MILKNINYKLKTLIFSALFLTCILLISLLLITIGSRKVFNQTTDSKLIQLGNIKTLQFESDLKSQLALVIQMAKSPTIVSYMENPSDKELYTAALKEFKSYQDSFLSKSSFWVSDSDYRFYSDLAYAYTVDPEDPASSWYKMTVFETDVYNFNINYNPELQKTMLWINAVVKNENQKPVGMAGTGIPLNGLFDEVYSNLDKNISLYFYNNNFEITGALDTSLIENKTPISEIMEELSDKQIAVEMPEVLSTNKGEYVFVPIPTVNWFIVLFQPYTLKDAVSNSLTLVVILLLVICGFVTVIFVMFVMNVLKSLSKVILETENDASMQKDFITNVKETVASTVKSLDQYSELMDQQTASIEESQSEISELVSQLHVLDSIRQDSLSTAKDLEKNSNEGQNYVENLRTQITELVKCSDRLVEANKLIADVTSQTDLLALNAAIEAAHAGELGAGFAVVAREIRKLAVKSRDQEDKVELAINDMKNMVGQMVENSKFVSSSFDTIVENSGNVNANFEEMSESIREQNTLGKTIDSNLETITKSVKLSGGKFEIMRHENEELAEQVKHAADNSEILLEKTKAALKSTGIK
ncbi:methyl-accepting chemotaxis protein [Treponema sp.]|uniref:methyl-accepting chemotaxis protein n=1 Tax=Treponema sp. TaxID=166 RepID=UPI00388CFC5A